jgi:plasmid stabilization system protein ParE
VITPIRPLPVNFATAATDDAGTARRWLEQVRPGLASALMAELDRVVERIAENPELYQRFRGECRRAVLRKFDYAMVYRVLPDRIQVVAVLHCRLDPALAVDRVATAPV